MPQVRRNMVSSRDNALRRAALQFFLNANNAFTGKRFFFKMGRNISGSVYGWACWQWQLRWQRQWLRQ